MTVSGKADTEQLHATCVSVNGAGVLFLGKPGAGKSDLALRLIGQNQALLVADDQVVLRREGARLTASPPQAIAGKLEVRGLGITDVAHERDVPLKLCVLLAPHDLIERMPELAQQRFVCLGVTIALVEIDAAQASAPARVLAALAHIQRP